MSSENITYVLYDGQCAFCRRSVETLRRRDRQSRLRLVDAHALDVRTIHPSLTLSACLEELHAVTPDAHVLRGFDAFRHLWAQLPSTAWLAPLLYLPGVPSVGRLAYRWVARRRYALMQRDCPGGSCTRHHHSASSLPTTETPTS